MLLAAMGTWGLFEPGRMFAGWFCWAVELTGDRAVASGKRCSHFISPGLSSHIIGLKHNPVWGAVWGVSPWQPRPARGVLAFKCKAFHRELCEVVMVKCCCWICSALQTLHRGCDMITCRTFREYCVLRVLHRPEFILCGWCGPSRGHASPSNCSCVA